MPNHNFKDLTGQKFGRLTVIKRGENTNLGLARWVCKCDCGNEVLVPGSSLRNGHTTSCGCYKQEVVKTCSITHGMRHERIYTIWTSIKTRCYNQHSNRHHIYSDRNIGMCDEWKNDFQCFYDWAMANGYTDKLTIDRIDNDKGYSPDNCRWVTNKENCQNKRNNINITYKGKTQCLSAWCEELGLNYKTVHKKIVYQGFDIERAFTTP